MGFLAWKFNEAFTVDCHNQIDNDLQCDQGKEPVDMNYEQVGI